MKGRRPPRHRVAELEGARCGCCAPAPPGDGPAKRLPLAFFAGDGDDGDCEEEERNDVE